MRDPYAVLGVSRDASTDEIRHAYTTLAENYVHIHEDELGSNDRLRELREAYEVLTDPSRRSSYDAGAAVERPFEPPPGLPDAVPDAPGGGLFAPPPGSTFDLESREALLSYDELEAQHGPPEAPPPRRRSRNPIDRVTEGLPHWLRVTIDWTVTIAGAIGIVFAIKTWVVNPYRIPSSSMEPTLHCARPGSACLARFSDRVLACRFCYHLRKPHRGDIVVFNVPERAEDVCGSGGVFVKRLIGAPGDAIEYTDTTGAWVLRINGKRVREPYVRPDRAGGEPGTWHVPEGRYFFMGDNRASSCDSRRWGSVPRNDLIGPVFATYWPPNRISLR